MSTEQTTSRGIRLPGSLWKAIDEEALALKMSRNEYLARRLGALFVLSSAVQKSTKTVQRDEPMEELR